MSKAPGHRRRGFTLYEVIIVMILLVIMAGIVAPSFSGFFPGVKVRSASDTIIASTGKARADAVLTMRGFRIVFVEATEQAAAHHYLAYEADPLREPGVFHRLGGAWGAPEELPDDVTFESLEGAQEDSTTKEKYFEFRPDGTATEGSIVLAHAKGDRLTLKIAGTTGRVAVEEPVQE
jgi:prepilin-type N-terminal cleavage/methylation domain-containing protein